MTRLLPTYLLLKADGRRVAAVTLDVRASRCVRKSCDCGERDSGAEIIAADSAIFLVVNIVSSFLIPLNSPPSTTVAEQLSRHIDRQARQLFRHASLQANWLIK
jgi:hypothetical protein